MLATLTEKLLASENLSDQDVVYAGEHLLSVDESIESRADFLRALNKKGETPTEIAAFVKYFLGEARDPQIPSKGIIDVCGTGGDKVGLFNISSATMIVAAAAGARVVKHGNRGVTSRSGGADVLEALGVKIDHEPEAAAEILDHAGCIFLFAPRYHPSFAAVVPVRQILGKEGTTTIFNMIGPLLNPARPEFQLAGVFDEKLLPVYAETFRLLGRTRAWAVHGKAEGRGLDEISTIEPTRVLIAEESGISESLIDPKDFSLAPASLQSLVGGDATENAQIIVSLLEGKGPAPHREIVQLNAAAALVVSGKAADLPAAFAQAGEAITSGAATEALNRLRSFSR
jgi:anthranilate phosphoribosyltransferase